MRNEVLFAIAFAVVGLVIGLAVSVLALGMSGAGHGWMSASVSVFSLITAPMTGIAWGFRRRWWSRRLSLLLLAAAIILDVVLLLMTRNEGYNYVEYVMSAASDRFVLWILLFASWQLWALAAVLATMRIGKQPRNE